MGGPSTFSANRTPFSIELGWAQKILTNMKLMSIYMLYNLQKINFVKGCSKGKKRLFIWFFKKIVPTWSISAANVVDVGGIKSLQEFGYGSILRVCNFPEFFASRETGNFPSKSRFPGNFPGKMDTLNLQNFLSKYFPKYHHGDLNLLIRSMSP